MKVKLKKHKKTSAPVTAEQMFETKLIEVNIELSQMTENACNINKKDFLLKDTDLMFAKIVHQRLQALRNTIHH